MTLMQRQLMHPDFLSITNLIPYSATDLSQWHRAHDWLTKERMNFLVHDLSHAAILDTRVCLHAAYDDFNARAISAPSFSKHHKSDSVLCYRSVPMTSGSWLATCSTSCLTCGWQKERWTSWLMTYHMQQYLRLMSLAQWWLKCKGTFIV